MKIRLFTTRFSVLRPERRAEYDEALSRNAACPAIDEIFILEEGDPDRMPESTKITVRRIPGQPRYSDYFAWIDELAADDDVSIVANADIALDPHFTVFREWAMPPDMAFALARWELDGDRSVLRDRNDSQDAWVFRGRMKRVVSDFHIGVPRCDNRIAAELKQAGYILRNPSFSLRSYHIHSRRNAPYPTALEPGFVAPPYGYIWPHNLWGPARTLAYNLRHADKRVGWRLDRRKVKSRLRIHWFERGIAALSSRGPARDP